MNKQTTTKTRKPTTASDPRHQRKLLSMNQADYWGRVGVTQSGGSRYESGRNVPKPIQTLLDIAYGDKPLETLAALRQTSLEEIKQLGK